MPNRATRLRSEGPAPLEAGRRGWAGMAGRLLGHGLFVFGRYHSLRRFLSRLRLLGFDVLRQLYRDGSRAQARNEARRAVNMQRLVEYAVRRGTNSTRRCSVQLGQLNAQNATTVRLVPKGSAWSL